MRRGDIYTAATGSGFGGKPRPVLVLQADAYCASPHIVVALIASPTADPPSTRIVLRPTDENGLNHDSEVQVDILLTVRSDRFGQRIGRLGGADLRRVETALLALLGFA